MKRFGLTQIQADSILELKLRRLTGLERNKIEEELNNLLKLIEELKAILASIIISFGGICIHAQTFSIIETKKIRYLPYLIARIIHSFISATLTYIFLKIFN